MDRKRISDDQLEEELFRLSSDSEDSNLFGDDSDDDPDFTVHELCDISG